MAIIITTGRITYYLYHIVNGIKGTAKNNGIPQNVQPHPNPHPIRKKKINNPSYVTQHGINKNDILSSGKKKSSHSYVDKKKKRWFLKY